MADLSLHLAVVLEGLPVAIGLVSRTGRYLGKAGGMAELMGDMIPSYDAHQAGRWTMTDANGRVLAPSQYPSARALRGERNYRGAIGHYNDRDGRRAVKVISVPTLDPTSEVAAVTFLQVFDDATPSAAGSHIDLQQRLIDELARAVATGWDRFDPIFSRKIA